MLNGILPVRQNQTSASIAALLHRRYQEVAAFKADDEFVPVVATADATVAAAAAAEFVAIDAALSASVVASTLWCEWMPPWWCRELVDTHGFTGLMLPSGALQLPSGAFLPTPVLAVHSRPDHAPCATSTGFFGWCAPGKELATRYPRDVEVMRARSGLHELLSGRLLPLPSA